VEQRPVKVRSNARIDAAAGPAKHLEGGVPLAVVARDHDDTDRERGEVRFGEPGVDGVDGQAAVRRDLVSPFDPVGRAGLFRTCEQPSQVTDTHRIFHPCHLCLAALEPA